MAKPLPCAPEAGIAGDEVNDGLKARPGFSAECFGVSAREGAKPTPLTAENHAGASSDVIGLGTGGEERAGQGAQQSGMGWFAEQ